MLDGFHIYMYMLCLLYRMHQDWLFKFGREVKNSKRRQSHRGKYGCKRTHDVVEGTVLPQLLITRKAPTGRHSTSLFCRSTRIIIHLMNVQNAAWESGRRSARMYAEPGDHYSNCRKPQYQMFARVHQQLWETRSVTNTCHDRESNWSTQIIQSWKLSYSL